MSEQTSKADVVAITTILVDMNVAGDICENIGSMIPLRHEFFCAEFRWRSDQTMHNLLGLMFDYVGLLPYLEGYWMWDGTYLPILHYPYFAGPQSTIHTEQIECSWRTAKGELSSPERDEI